MGAWGVGNWDNDEVSDWLIDLAEMPTVEAAVAAIEAALSGSTRDAGDCCRALAAAEIVAACIGRPGGDLDRDAEAWLREHRDAVPLRLVEPARKIVRAILSGSVLQELFDYRGRNDEWHALVEDLLARLG